MGEVNEPLPAQYGVSSSCAWASIRARCWPVTSGDGYTVIGDAVNVAARLQAAARPGNVTVGERDLPRDAARRSTTCPAGAAGAEGQGRAGAGLGGADRPTSEHTAGAAARRPAQAPLVGRSDELAAAADLLARVARKRGPHLATVIGEAGVGKSRLLRQFELDLQGATRRRWCAADAACRMARASSTGRSARLFAASAGSSTAIPPALAWAKLLARLGRAARRPRLRQPSPRRAKTAVIGRLLGIEAPEDAAASQSRGGRPARARSVLRGRALLCGGAGARGAAGARVGGHPLGR